MDANILVTQLNWLATNLLGSLVTRWIAYIRLFDFEVQYVLGRKHTTTNRLSRHLHTKSNNINKAHEIDIKEFIDFELGALSIALVRVEENRVDKSTTTTTKNILEKGYSKNSQKIVQYLTTLRRPKGIGKDKFQAFKKRTLLYTIINKQLY